MPSSSGDHSSGRDKRGVAAEKRPGWPGCAVPDRPGGRLAASGGPAGARAGRTGAGAERVTPRALGAGAVALLALVATSLVAGPASAAPPGGPCALPRTPAHHSEGLDTWNGAYPRPLGSLDAVLVFLSFPDATPRTTPAELTADYFPDATNFFDRSSYGRFTLRPHPQKEWLTMPQPSTAYEIRRDWNAASRSAYLRDALKAADPVVDFSRYDIVYFVADPDAPGVDSDATKVVNFSRPLEADGTPIRRVVTLFERHPPDRNVLAHETGHVFDLPDLYHRPTDNKGDWDTHVGDWDLMGSQFGLGPDLFAWHKWKLGWLGHQQITCVQGEGSHRLSLEPVAADAPLPGSGTRLAVVPEGPAPSSPWRRVPPRATTWTSAAKASSSTVSAPTCPPAPAPSRSSTPTRTPPPAGAARSTPTSPTPPSRRARPSPSPAPPPARAYASRWRTAPPRAAGPSTSPHGSDQHRKPLET